MDDMKNLEETNHSLCDKLQYMQNLLDDEKHEHDQVSLVFVICNLQSLYCM